MNIPHFLATEAVERAVWLSFAFYLLNLLVPIIPAVAIYWLFPEGKTGDTPNSSVQGTVGGWKIKAIGAWGAYVTAFLLGYWAIRSTALPLIKEVAGKSVWTIEATFLLQDANGRPINETLDTLKVDPPAFTTSGARATITEYSDTDDPPEELPLTLDGYEPKTVSLKGLTARNNKITLRNVPWRKQPPLDRSLPAATPLPPGEGPSPLTANQ